MSEALQGSRNHKNKVMKSNFNNGYHVNSKMSFVKWFKRKSQMFVRFFSVLMLTKCAIVYLKKCSIVKTRCFLRNPRMNELFLLCTGY